MIKKILFYICLSILTVFVTFQGAKEIIKEFPEINNELREYTVGEIEDYISKAIDEGFKFVEEKAGEAYEFVTIKVSVNDWAFLFLIRVKNIPYY